MYSLFSDLASEQDHRRLIWCRQLKVILKPYCSSSGLVALTALYAPKVIKDARYAQATAPSVQMRFVVFRTNELQRMKCQGVKEDHSPRTIIKMLNLCPRFASQKPSLGVFLIVRLFFFILPCEFPGPEADWCSIYSSHHCRWAASGALHGI